MAVGQAPYSHPHGAALKKNQKTLMKPLAYKKNEIALGPQGSDGCAWSPETGPPLLHKQDGPEPREGAQRLSPVMDNTDTFYQSHAGMSRISFN